MKIGFRTAGFHRWPLSETLSCLKRIGYDGVELCLEAHDLRPDLLTPERLSEVRNLLTPNALELASVSYHADGEDLRTRVPNTIKAIAATRQLGHGILIVNAEKRREGETEQQWLELVQRFRVLADAAAQHDVTLAIEPEPGLLIHGMADFGRLKQEVDRDRLRINLDIGHCHITDDLLATIATWRRDIVHLHFEDLPGKTHQHLVPGEGDMDLAAVVRALEQSGYAGYVTIDLFRIANDPEGYARRAYSATARLLAGR